METERYSRHLLLERFGAKNQARLHAATIAVVGAGGLACPALPYLVSSGIGTVRIIDHDIVQPTNLHRQTLYGQEDIGAKKALAATLRLGPLLAPHQKIEPQVAKLEAGNAENLLSGTELVIDCSDNFATKYLIEGYCTRKAIPYVVAAVEGWTAQLMLCNYPLGSGDRSLHYSDVFPQASGEENCDTEGILSTSAGFAGMQQAHMAVMALAGLGGQLCNRFFTVDLFSLDFQAIQLEQPTSRPKEESPLEIGIEDLSSFPGIGIYNLTADALPPTRPEFATYVSIDPIELLSAESLPSPMLLVCEKGNKSLLLAKKIREQRPGLEIYSLKSGVQSLQ